MLLLEEISGTSCSELFLLISEGEEIEEITIGMRNLALDEHIRKLTHSSLYTLVDIKQWNT